jgi:hypothetical protein
MTTDTPSPKRSFQVGDKVRRKTVSNRRWGSTNVGATGVVESTAMEGSWADVRLDKNGLLDTWHRLDAELIEPPVSAQVAELEGDLRSTQQRLDVAESVLRDVSYKLEISNRDADKLRAQVRDLQRDQPPFTNAEASRIVGQVFDVLTGKIKAPNGQRDYTIPVYEPGSIYEHDGWRNYPSGVRTVRVSW